jgi:predicted SAM-dependent methyltransferase
MKCFSVKHTPSGRALLNLACGPRTDATWNNLDFSPYARLRRHPLLVNGLRAVGLLSRARCERLRAIDPEIVCWNLTRGIPFDDRTFDAVYHSHFLEHLDRAAALRFLGECWRVLKPGGILRIVLPDLETLVRLYSSALSDLDRNGESPTLALAHERAIAEIFDQMVRTRSSGTEEQKPWVRRIEQRIRGNSLATGENHRWMYDGHSLGRILARLGFVTIREHTAQTSAIAGWDECFLDYNPDGSAYKENSLYLEAERPVRETALRLQWEGKVGAA